ncbi:unnamed protein product [Camellia sinensis]
MQISLATSPTSAALQHRRPDEHSSPTLATIEVERSFYNPSDRMSGATDDNESHSRRPTTIESVSVFPPDSLLSISIVKNNKFFDGFKFNIVVSIMLR